MRLRAILRPPADVTPTASVTDATVGCAAEGGVTAGPRAGAVAAAEVRPIRWSSAGLGLAAVLALAEPAPAILVGGGGSGRTDCLAVFDAPANHPRRRPRAVRCADGAPCDADGVVNGRCAFAVALCANSTGDPRCALRGVESIVVAHARDDGDRLFDPEFQALQARVLAAIAPPTAAPDACTLPTTIQVTVRGPNGRRHRCRAGRKRLEVTAYSELIAGRVHLDRDRLELRCDPAPEGCSPRALFAGTFDRIQRQIFDQGCAVGGCHDSQSRQADLLLEAGAAHANLVNAVPTTFAAAALGWSRVAVSAPGVGDPATSLLLHKLTGALAPGLGARMPLDGRRLDRTLVDVVARWIAAGAPAEGWVPGTD